MILSKLKDAFKPTYKSLVLMAGAALLVVTPVWGNVKKAFAESKKETTEINYKGNVISIENEIFPNAVETVEIIEGREYTEKGITGETYIRTFKPTYLRGNDTEYVVTKPDGESFSVFVRCRDGAAKEVSLRKNAKKGSNTAPVLFLRDYNDDLGPVAIFPPDPNRTRKEIRNGYATLIKEMPCDLCAEEGEPILDSKKILGMERSILEASRNLDPSPQARITKATGTAAP